MTVPPSILPIAPRAQAPVTDVPVTGAACLNCGSAAAVPAGVPSLPFLLYLPALALGIAYVAIADRRVHGGAWWIAALRALVLTAVAAAVVTGVIIATNLM